MSDDDLWGVDSDLVTDYEGLVTDAWFAIDTNWKFGNSPTFLWLKMATDNERLPEITERYNCGPDWISTDGGETITHPTKRKFSGNSQAGIFVGKAIELAGDSLRDRGIPPTTAAAWIGTKWYMEAVERKGKNNQTGEDWKSVKNYPAKFLGVEDSGKAQGEMKLSEVETAPASPLMEIVKNLAQTLPHDEWVDSVLQVEGVLSDDELIAQLPDSSEDGLYETLRNDNE